MFIQTLFFVSWFRRNSQFVSSFSSSSSKDFSSIGRSHSVHKTVLISSFSFRWLKRSFAHCFVSLKIFVKYLFIGSKSMLFQNRVQIYKDFFFWQVVFEKYF